MDTQIAEPEVKPVVQLTAMDIIRSALGLDDVRSAVRQRDSDDLRERLREDQAHDAKELRALILEVENIAWRKMKTEAGDEYLARLHMGLAQACHHGSADADKLEGKV